MIARLRELDDEARRRGAELQARQDQAAQEVAAARSEVERLREFAAEAASRLRAEATAEAEQIRHRVRAESGRVRAEAQLELKRLGGLRDETWADLARLCQTLRSQLDAAGG